MPDERPIVCTYFSWSFTNKETKPLILTLKVYKFFLLKVRKYN
ncbi:hypothetical protein M23134_07034 [Microscilla marina ATCC 23134]|uniref:Uncharacterized protein n=1 Tax=Microscilla marina ATCC 23134 TaxID=313606 RepID=A1ZT50_MICM2|nr:hypothetical protein M23134_07034 [Microscilla marina ATCC 23134]